MEKSLMELRELYQNRGCPPIEQVAEAADLSTSTAQRYLNGFVKRADYTKIVSLRRALGDEGEVLSSSIDPELVRKMDDTDQLQALVLEMRQINISELNVTRAAINQEWERRLDSIVRTHVAEIERLEHAHERERDTLHKTQSEQLNVLRELCDTQKRADERSKDYLKRQIFLWRIIALVLFTVLIALLVADILNPTKGWVRMLGSWMSINSSLG